MLTWVFLGVAAIPFIYYLIALYSSWRYFRNERKPVAAGAEYNRPVSVIKPIRGLDPDAYENFASFCRQDYPDYEIVFCVGGEDEPALEAIDKLKSNFPERQIRVLYGSGRVATNDKCAKLARLVSEARHEVVVISDSDVRVRPDYLRKVTAPLADPSIGAVTCMYVSVGEKNLTEELQVMGMMSDFYAGVLVAWQLDGVKFALGPTIATKRSRLAGFGGYEALENRPADDLLVGRLIAEQGYEVRLLSYPIETVADYQSMKELLQKRLRWIVVMRHMRPWGHFGLLLTQGLPWCLAAVAVHPTLAVAGSYLGLYLAMRIAMTWLIGIWGMKQKGLWSKMWLIPVWDAIALAIWLVSFSQNTVRWRGREYYIREGRLAPVSG